VRIKRTWLLGISGLLVLIIALIPLLIIGWYAFPCADDFTYGAYPHAMWIESGSLQEVFHWALYQVKATYDTWQGTFSSVFLMALSPAVFGESNYFFTSIIMLGMTVLSHFVFSWVIFRKLFRTNLPAYLLFASMLTFLIVETVVSPVNAFYWFNGSVHYVFMHSCMLLLLTMEIMLLLDNTKKKKLLFTFLSILMAIACGGSNYITALLSIICSYTLAFMSFIGKGKRRSLWLLVPIGVLSSAFTINVTAYGNVLRQENFQKSSPLHAILKSFHTALTQGIEWLGIPLVLIAILLIPLFWNTVAQISFPFPMPWLVSGFSFCLLACTFTPNYYSTGVIGPERVMNIIRMWSILLFLCNEAYWIGWLRKTFFPGKKDLTHYWLFYLIMGVVMLIHIRFAPQTLTQYSSYSAWISLRSGEAHLFQEENRERLALLHSEEQIITLPEYSVKPYMLYFDDITTDRYDWRNVAMARWFLKEYVVLEDQ
jgi:hypothetical protein